MTNTIRLSLAAALVATSVSAVEFSTSGSFKAEYEFGTTSSEFDYDIDVTVKGKFSDNWAAVTTVQADQDTTNGTDAASETITEDTHYVVYTNGATTINAGRVDVGTTMFDDEIGNGYVAMTTFNGVTAAIAQLDAVGVTEALDTDTDISGANITAAGLMGSLSGINMAGWYADVSNIADAYTLAADTKVGSLALSALVYDIDFDTVTTDNDDYGLYKVGASLPISNFTVALDYAKTGKDGSGLLVDDTAADLGMDQTELFDTTLETKFTVLTVSTEVSGASVDLSVGATKVDGGNDTTEAQIALSYPLAAGATLSALYSNASTDGSADVHDGYVALKFKF